MLYFRRITKRLFLGLLAACSVLAFTSVKVSAASVPAIYEKDYEEVNKGGEVYSNKYREGFIEKVRVHIINSDTAKFYSNAVISTQTNYHDLNSFVSLIITRKASFTRDSYITESKTSESDENVFYINVQGENFTINRLGEIQELLKEASYEESLTNESGLLDSRLLYFEDIPSNEAFALAIVGDYIECDYESFVREYWWFKNYDHSHKTGKLRIIVSSYSALVYRSRVLSSEQVTRPY